MSYSNLLYNTIGMFFIIFVFSLLNTALIELPVRQLIKYLMNKNLESYDIKDIQHNKILGHCFNLKAVNDGKELSSVNKGNSAVSVKCDYYNTFDFNNTTGYSKYFLNETQ